MATSSPFSTAELLRRREAVRRAMRERGIDALIVGPGANLYYLAGVWGHQTRRFTALVLGAHSTEQECFVCPAFEEAMHRDSVKDVADFRAWARRSPPEAAATDALKSWGLRASGKIAVDQAVPWMHAAPLLAAAPHYEFVTGSEVMSDVRAIKSPDELALMRSATIAAREAIDQVVAQLHEGASEEDLEKQFIAAAQDETGAAESWILMLFGPSSAEPHGSPLRRKRAADEVVLFDFGTSRSKYRSDTTRTVLYGQAPDEAKRVWQTVSDAYWAARRAVRPGMTFTELDAVARRVIESAGYGGQFTHGLGHGIGLEVHERPFPEPVGDFPLRAGMTITIEPGIYLPGRFGVRLEDTVVITEEGCEPIYADPPMAMTP